MNDKELERVGNAIGDSITRIVEIAIKARGGWPLAIPVSERLPGESCLAYATSVDDPAKHGWVVGDLCFGQTNWWCLPEDWAEPVSHWIPLPPDPTPPDDSNTQSG
mgnify:FL=1